MREKHRTLVATMILVGASCLGLSFCGSLSSSPNAFSISESHTDINVNLVNGVAIRILNSAATAEITELDLSTTAAPTGTFVTDNFKVEVSTANKTGYKLYMNSSYQNPSTSTYTTDLVNQTNTNYTIPTVAAAVSKTDLSTAAPGTTNANKWAYSLDDTTYSPVPANSVQTQIDSHDTPTAGTRTPVYIGMNVNVEKPSGVYKNQLTFSAVGNPVPTDYSLYFEPGGTGVSGLPETMTYSGVASSYTFTIPSTAPTRDGYGFTGYSDGSTTYQPGDTITIVGDIDYTGTATLTAQWEQNFWTISTMQQMTSTICNSVYTPSNATGSAVTIISDRATYEATATADNQPYVAQRTLRDIRDSKNYTIRKLADGNCWMTQTIGLKGPRTLVPESSDVSSSFYLRDTPTDDFSNFCGYDTDECIDYSRSSYTDTYGVVAYNWYGATAGTGRRTAPTQIATSSVCAKNWKLPSDDNFSSLVNSYTNVSAVPVDFRNAFYGMYNAGSGTYVGGIAAYWTSYSENVGTASMWGRILYISGDNNPVIPYGVYKMNGAYVRCVAR